MRLKVISFLFLLIPCFAQGQYSKVNVFTMADGLPSNIIYKCVEDRNGFLWIGCSGGVLRFDGKYFQLYNAKQGVPDIDVTNVIMDKDGLIWIDVSSGKIAYYDTLHNRFVNSDDDSNLAIKRKPTYPFKPIMALPEGGVRYANLYDDFIIKKRIVRTYPNSLKMFKNLILKCNSDSSEIRLVQENKYDSISFLYHTKHNKILEKKILRNTAVTNRYYLEDNVLYLFNEKSPKVLRFYQFESSPLRYTADSIMTDSMYYAHSFTTKYFVKLNSNGDIYVYDKINMRLKFNLKHGSYVSDLCMDSKNNLWLSSPKGEGLVLYRAKSIMSDSLNQPHYTGSNLSIVKQQNGHLLIGNSNGEILEIAHKIKRHVLFNASNTALIRHIIISQNKLFSFGENGIIVNYSKRIEHRNNKCKYAYTLNDSIILCGYNDGLSKLNTKTEKINSLNSGRILISSVASPDGSSIYVGSTDGLRLYLPEKDTILKMASPNSIQSQNIISLCTTPDHLLWVSTATQGVYALKANQVVYHIDQSTGLKTAVPICMTSGRGKQVWLGTNLGISVINYNNGTPHVQNLSTVDGLPRGAINQLYYDKDTVYAATDVGISKIPVSDTILAFNIPIVLTGIKINGIDTVLKNYYHLNSEQKYFVLQFAGVELTGHFKNAQYSDNKGKTWNDLESNNLSLKLGSGKNYIWFRAVDVNNQISNHILKLQFDIDQPFYLQWPFLLSTFLFVLTITIYVSTRYSKRKQQKKIDELMQQQIVDEFEIQALKAQINPHFVFNCLNSIKGIIYDEDFERANLYLNKFAIMLRSTLSYSSKPNITLQEELDYIDNYLLLEKLRFGNKFEYRLEIDENVNLAQYAIPSMLLQPFVENAIIHGIASLQTRLGEIVIKVFLKEDSLHILISDNGIGRKNSAALQAQRIKTYESKGTQLTQRRMELYQITCEYIDLLNDAQESIGTTIHLSVPITS